MHLGTHVPRTHLVSYEFCAEAASPTGDTYEAHRVAIHDVAASSRLLYREFLPGRHVVPFGMHFAIRLNSDTVVRVRHS